MKNSLEKIQQSIQKELKSVIETFKSDMDNFNNPAESVEIPSLNLDEPDTPSYSKVVTRNLKENPKVTKNKTPKIVYQYELEKEQKSSALKRNNICIFNLPESSKTDPEEAYVDDIARLKQVFEDKIVLEKK